MAIGFAGATRTRIASPTFSGTTFSMCAYVFFTSLPTSGNYMSAFSRGHNGIDVHNTSGTSRISIGTDVNDFDGSVIAASAWRHLGYTRNASNIHKLYLDGVLNVTSSADTSAGTDLVFGSYAEGTNTDPLSGNIAYARTWDGVELTASDFAAEMASTTIVHTGGEWAVYRFLNAATATTDGSGNSHTLSTTGTLTDQSDPTIGGGGGGGGRLHRGATALDGLGGVGQQRFNPVLYAPDGRALRHLRTLRPLPLLRHLP